MYPACALRPDDRAVREVRHAWAVFRTTTGSMFLRSSNGPPVREYRCRDTLGLRDHRRCSKSWRLWQRCPRVLWGDGLWSRWTLDSRFDRRTLRCWTARVGLGRATFFYT